ncbi:MAG: hypothetical protein A2W27_04560 [Deltaproteobacteria bacterium RBG_16_44_11]|nr:MAG: hypothetical protein A2W27_04560 [Deltaproteobacteria bacterium RBG_16_44_11]
MDEGTVGILVLIIISIIVSIATHAVVANFSRALVISVIISCVAFQVAAFIHIGYLDKFFIIAVITTSFIIGIISALVGLPFYLKRKKSS